LNIRNAISKYASALKPLLKNSRTLELPPMPAAAQAFILLALRKTVPQKTILWINDTSTTLEQSHRNITTLSADSTVSIAYFPPTETDSDPETAGHRLQVLQQLNSKTPPDIIVTCIQALLQNVPPPESLQSDTITFDLDSDIDLDEVTAKLQQTGYSFEPEVQNKGEAAIKGGLLDIWAPTDLWPTRIELFGPTVESIRHFDPATQRSIDKCPAAAVPPITVISGQTDRKLSQSRLTDYIKNDCAAVWNEPGSITTHAQTYSNLTDNNSEFKISDFISNTSQSLSLFINPDHHLQQPENLPAFTPLKHTVETPHATPASDRTEESRQKMISDLKTSITKRHHLALFCNTKGSLAHITENLLYPQLKKKSIHPHTGMLSDGFDCPDLRLTIIAESSLYGHRKTLNRRYDPYAGSRQASKQGGRRISDFTDMEAGDMVVHIEHGIGRYIGIQKITFNNKEQEVLAIQYADDAKLYVPMSHAHLLSRYVGLSSRKAHLHKLGGKRWSRDKTEAQKAVMDLAADLLEVQAARNLLQGHAFPDDNIMQHEFATSFPFQETADQLKVIEAIKEDMQSTRPMDRLVCGDAGYGKTEVAMRAAFRTVQNRLQVAMLVPTTILAQQHFRTFTERMAGFPVRIEVLSRFCTAKKRREIIEGTKEGTIDIIIGTHALVSPDVSFANLGLVIIDEEQRFGVKHKEHLKHMKQLVDVLTLSATPIPRTLYMSMTGARDMSLLQTPPRERMAIETIIATADDAIIRKAVLRELQRDGQVYYLHNRVMTIYRLRDRLIKLLPEARIEVAHGQMKSSELADVMQRFTAGEFDLLLCTTIIESGMDIPRANTILIDRADRFGIADLYQLRGRVGRSNHKAYAYLLLPPHGYIDSDARERIHAIRKHSDLGAGFNLAVRDMEIRGAGNILGAAQSGHIAAVGFGIYCQLLKRSIAKLKGEKAPPLIDTEIRLDFISLTPGSLPTDESAPAYIPFSYISSERLRVATYRRIAESTESNDIEALQHELRDRFGKIPPTVSRLLTIAEIRIQAARKQIQSLAVRNSRIIIRINNQYTKTAARFPTLTATAPDNKLHELQQYIINH